MARKNELIKKRLFADDIAFDPKGGGYAAFPIVLRRVQRLFEPRAWQVYSYILMRVDPSGICWFSLSEMCFDLDFESAAKLRGWVKKVTDAGWIRTTSSTGKDYYFVRDPLVVLDEKFAAGTLSEELVEAVNETLASASIPLLGSPRPKTTPGGRSLFAGKNDVDDTAPASKPAR